MADVQQQLAQLLADFTDKVTALASQAVVESARAVLGNGHRHTTIAAPSQRIAAPTTVSRPRGQRGGTTEVAVTGAQIVSHLVGRPGQRMDELTGVLGLPTASVAPVVRKLVAQGLVRFEGNTRGRRYYAIDGATSGTNARAPKARRRGARGTR